MENHSMKKICAQVTLFFFSFGLFAYSGSMEEGIKYLKEARRAQKLQMNSYDIREYLESAYRNFKRAQEPEARFYLIHVGRLLGKEDEVITLAGTAVRGEKDRYVTLVAELKGLTQQEKESLKVYLRDIETQFPFISDIRLEKRVFYPYRGDDLVLNLNLNAQSKLTLDVNAEPVIRLSLSPGTHPLSMSWEDRFLEDHCVDLKFTAENKIGSDSKTKKLCFNVQMPEGLYYNYSEFAISGKSFKSETRMIKKRNPGTLLSGLLLSAVIGLVFYINDEDADGNPIKKSDRILYGVLGGGLIFGLSLSAYSKSYKTVYLPDEGNILYNKNLKKEIEAKRKEIMVGLELTDAKLHQ